MSFITASGIELVFLARLERVLARGFDSRVRGNGISTCPVLRRPKELSAVILG